MFAKSSIILFFTSNLVSPMTVEFHTMTVEELFAWLVEKDTNATFIDVREVEELIAQGVIEGYDDNIPWFLTNTNPELFEKRFSELNREEKVIEYAGKVSIR